MPRSVEEYADQQQVERRAAKAEYARDWRQRNPEWMREYRQRPDIKTKERIRARERYHRPDVKARVRAYYSRPERKRRSRELNCLRAYGITWAEREALFEASDGLCAVCYNNVAMVLDHDHATGRVRGALCHACNTRLGWYERRADAIAQYLNWEARIDV